MHGSSVEELLCANVRDLTEGGMGLRGKQGSVEHVGHGVHPQKTKIGLAMQKK